MTPGAIFRPSLRHLLILGLAACAGGSRAADPGRVVLQLPYLHQFQFAGYYAAQSQGFFQQHDLEVEIRPTTEQRRSALTEVQEGRAQFGLSQGARLVANRLSGQPFVAVAAIMQHSPLVLLTRAEANLHTPHDLIGKRVALDETDLGSEIRLMLEREGVDFSRIQLVPNLWNVGELLEGRTDAESAFLIDGPYLRQQAGVKVSIIRPLDYGVDFYGDTLFTTEAFLQKNRRVVEAMRLAVLQGWKYALEHPEEMVDWIIAHCPDRNPALDRPGLLNEARLVAVLINADLVEPGHMNSGRWTFMGEAISRYTPNLDQTRLQGFQYDAPEAGFRKLSWLGWGLAAVSALALAVILANRRLQLLVRRRTQELQQAEQQQRDYFELAPAPIMIEDCTAFDAVLAGFHAEGVTDLRTHLRAHPDLVRGLMRKKRIIAANRAALARSGFATVAALNEGRPGLATTEACDSFVEELVALWLGVDRLMLERSYQTKSGETIDSILNWEVSRKDGLRDLANVRLVFTEITEQKRAEQALRQSEERYRELFEQAVGGIYRTSPEGRFLSVNPAMARILGFEKPEEMITWSGSNPTLGLYVQPGRRDEFISALNTCGQLNDFESEVSHRGGGTVWISENARPVRDEAGRLLYYEGFVTDISARRHLESEIGRASKLEAVGILAGGIAHNFNNILTVVLGNVTLAEADTAAGSPVRARLQDAKRATLRARDLTLQLLTFAKGGEPVRTTIELPDLLKESAGFALHGSKARSEFRFAPGLWKVNADKGQVGQVIQNLVINAVQAMPDGGIVTVSAGNAELPRPGDSAPLLPVGRYVQIAVADTGLGIAREHLGKIFDPYFTTKALGTGLGLASVYSIVRKHEGHIVVESEPGQGTVFRFWLPAVSGNARGPATSATGSKSPFRARALFMDDEPLIRSMAVLFMERLGYDCEVAVDGAEAVKKYQEAMAAGRKYEVVVMDLTVPGGMGGREAMEHLRRIDPGVYAIVSSGYSRDPVLANYQAHGFQAVLPKPYGLEQLTKVMRAALESPGNPT